MESNIHEGLKVCTEEFNDDTLKKCPEKYSLCYV